MCCSNLIFAICISSICLLSACYYRVLPVLVPPGRIGSGCSTHCDLHMMNLIASTSLLWVFNHHSSNNDVSFIGSPFTWNASDPVEFVSWNNKIFSTLFVKRLIIQMYNQFFWINSVNHPDTFLCFCCVQYTDCCFNHHKPAISN